MKILRVKKSRKFGSRFEALGVLGSKSWRKQTPIFFQKKWGSVFYNFLIRALLRPQIAIRRRATISRVNYSRDDESRFETKRCLRSKSCRKQTHIFFQKKWGSVFFNFLIRDLLRPQIGIPWCAIILCVWKIYNPFFGPFPREAPPAGRMSPP